MSLIEKLVRGLARESSERRRDWARAALAELPAVDGPLSKLEWLAGAATMLIGDLLVRTFAPWTRKAGETPPDGFAAALGAMMLAPSLYLLAAYLLDGVGVRWLIAPINHWMENPQAATAFDRVTPFVILITLTLAAWTNISVIFRGQHLGGLLYAIGLRVRPWNLAVIGIAGGLFVMLGGHALSEAFVFLPH